MSRKTLGGGSLIAAIVLASFWMGGMLSTPSAASHGSSIQRFQISAWGGDEAQHGCYVLDTYTGQLWHCRRGTEVTKVDGLPDAEP